MREGVVRAGIEQLLDDPRSVEVGETAIEYDGDIKGWPFRVVVVRYSDPPLVITVFEIDR